MAIQFSFISSPTDDIALEKYKTLIVHISLMLSIITVTVSLLLVIVATFLSKDESSTYVDLNINGGDGTRPKTYVYIQKDSPSFALQLEGKKSSVSVDASMGGNGGEERNEGAVNEAGKGNNSSGQTMDDGEKVFVLDGAPQPLPKGTSKGDEVNPAEKQNEVIRIVMK
ncbi:hypothetical protein C922_00052 [Plasmodium inui San Antonio 1]|uniref:Uncharacterized protein n=1 Tax=Plasmodium inui San Antonio 1 TaxID=1237626 RepID=W7AK33_9APIC|nr:hypothetical protein C922_00052 [Plasmodium inui San Antonio 1]EUD69189.1 hypothetical protein C922_00052 [Plasmodium inui San Antonio 1]